MQDASLTAGPKTNKLVAEIEKKKILELLRMDNIESMGGHMHKYNFNMGVSGPLISPPNGWQRLSGGTLPASEDISIFLKHRKGKNTALAKGIVTVHTADVAVLAYLWDVLSYERIHQNRVTNSGLLIEAKEVPDSKSKIIR